MNAIRALRSAASVLVLAAGPVFAAPPPGDADHAPSATNKIAPWLASHLPPGGQTEFLVVLEDAVPLPADPPGSPAAMYARLSQAARASQAQLLEQLRARGAKVRPFYIVNAVLVSGDSRLAMDLAARTDVKRIVGNPHVVGVEPTTGFSSNVVLGIEWGVTMVRAPEVWTGFGTKGQGIVVASTDTGVDWTHPAIHAQYRGWNAGNGTADHSYSWHDAIQPTTAPLDDYGHGTHTVGTMVGDDGGSNQIGVAPGARWIGCRNMDHGVGTPSRYLDCMEWTLAPYPPGGDPFVDGRPDLAPQIVNNSWGCPASEGCDWSTLETAFARLRDAGIFEIVSAGNAGSSCSTVIDPPGIYGEVLSVAALNSSKTLASFSSRGPVTVDGSNRLKPDVAAPGVSVRSCIPGGVYANMSGTSMASPHTSGVAALLWAAKPALRGLVTLSQCILERSASSPVNAGTQTCGGIPSINYPNNQVGYGLVDAYAAVTAPNADGDPAPDACDCRPADPGVFAAPVEATGLSFGKTGTSLLSWNSQAGNAGSSTQYDLLRGDVDTLLANGDLRQAVCLGAHLASTSLSDGAAPATGKAFYYLVRAKNACGTGGYGSTSAGVPRVSSACD